MSPAFAAFVAVLTVLGWGGGELIGHGVNRYLTRRSVKRWLEAEARWQRYEKRRRVEAGKPSRGPMPKPAHLRMVEAGIMSPSEARRGVLAESIRNNPSVQAVLKETADQLAGDWHRSLQAISGWTDSLTGQRCELYKENIVPGRIRFTVYRDGREAESWDESSPEVIRGIDYHLAGRTGET